MPGKGVESEGQEQEKVADAFVVFIYPFFFAQDDYRRVLGSVLEDPCWQLEVTSPWAVDSSSRDPSIEEERRHLRYFYPYVREFFLPFLCLC
ncbi:hypothetical protein [Ammonifex thiophilus]|uniref:hypothetical protein n=1 Tax=Ammonifex thiophilus TaxID=444093 RepID=UPI00106BE0C5|nr:hypothetical protein [Ammonifex thiophilus]